MFASETGSTWPTRLCGSATRPRFRRASLRNLRFHDLRHTFGTRMISEADIRRVQEWMGHADIQTTMKYSPLRAAAEDARLVAEAFKSSSQHAHAELAR